ncbi:hypothetical protein PAPHI01_0762 [Pancytospora philotis]|nr:hypothetical protein PAPHI01_0762 [Pancytospora philotis]
MTIYYTQILNAESKKILAGDYSGVGQALKSDKSHLKELRKAIFSVPGTASKIFTASDSTGKYVFYFRIDGAVLLCAMADKRTAAAQIEEYFDAVAARYAAAYSEHSTTHYEFDDALRQMADEHNKKPMVSRSAEALDSAHRVLIENLDTIINRGENIDHLKNQAFKMHAGAQELFAKSAEAKRRAQIERYKVYAVFAAILVLILYFFVFR